MKIISVINYKGGVGKTTVTANLAAELAFRGKKVLMIDLDPQTSLTFSFFKPDYWKIHLAPNQTIKNWFDQDSPSPRPALEDLVITPPVAKNYGGRPLPLAIIASHLALINVDLELATLLGGANMTQSKKNFLKVHMMLDEGLRSIEKEEYEIVLIDCPPNFNIVTKNAIVASDYVLIPAKPDYLSTMGIDYLLQSIRELVSNFNEYDQSGSNPGQHQIDPQIIGVIFTMVQFYRRQPIQALRPFIQQVRNLGVSTFNSMIRENKSFHSTSPQYGIPVVLNSEHDNRSNVIRQEFESLTSELLTKLGI